MTAAPTADGITRRSSSSRKIASSMSTPAVQRRGPIRRKVATSAGSLFGDPSSWHGKLSAKSTTSSAGPLGWAWGWKSFSSWRQGFTSTSGTGQSVRQRSSPPTRKDLGGPKLAWSLRLDSWRSLVVLAVASRQVHHCKPPTRQFHTSFARQLDLHAHARPPPREMPMELAIRRTLVELKFHP